MEVAYAEVVDKEEENKDLSVMIAIEKDTVLQKEEMIEELEAGKSELEDTNDALAKEKESLSVELGNVKQELNVVKAEKKKKVNKAATKSFSSNKNTAKSKSGTSSQTSGNGWVTMTVNASAYTMVANGDKMGGTGLTSTGTVPTANRTMAVDPNVIPYGSKILYNGVTYTAEDTGGIIKGNKVDIYMDTLEQCVSFGRKNIQISVQFK